MWYAVTKVLSYLVYLSDLLCEGYIVFVVISIVLYCVATIFSRLSVNLILVHVW